MSTLDAGLPFFGVQVAPRGERLEIKTLTYCLASGSQAFGAGTSDDAGDAAKVAAALATLIFRYAGESIATIGMMDATAGASAPAVIPVSVSLDAHDPLSLVVSKIADIVRRAGDSGACASGAAKSDCATPAVVA